MGRGGGRLDLARRRARCKGRPAPDRHRTPGTAIRIELRDSGTTASFRIHNQGEPIAASLMERIFDYGVSGGAAGVDRASGQRGQGLFVARTYMGKMGGTIEARNEGGGVSLLLTPPRAA